MTPQEKSKELVNKYLQVYDGRVAQAKMGALIAVNEMIQQNGEIYLKDFGKKSVDFYKKKNAYLFEVKEEIKKL